MPTTGNLANAVAAACAPGEIHPVQQAFVRRRRAVRLLHARPRRRDAALLAQQPDPREDEIREALSGNLCRCTGYTKIFDAVRLAARR